MTQSQKQYFQVGDAVLISPQYGQPPLSGVVSNLLALEMLAIDLDNGTKATGCWPFVVKNSAKQST